LADEDNFFTRWSRRKVEAAPVLVEPAPQAVVEVPPPPDPPPTLEDTTTLTPASDFTRFVSADVAPEVKNAALKKLFADPHFNVMDGLDTYIDDYNKPDPLPEGWLRKMVQSQLLGLFDDEEKKPEDPAHPAPQPAAQLPTEPAAHEDTDLQLQPVDDAGCPGAEPGPGQDPAGQH
jgi:Protein of unknown function (DUF3306)